VTIDERLASEFRKNVINKILILDVERLPGITKQFWWDRGDLKNRYIHYETVERLPRTTIVCAKWYDSPEVIRLAEWDKGGRKKFLKRVHALLCQADIVVGHFITGADLPWLANDLHVEAGLDPIPPFKTIDTLKVIRKVFGVGSPFKSLDAFCKIAGLQGKTDSYDPKAMERAVTEKSQPDRDRLTEYCAADCIATQGLLDFLTPHLPNPPALFVDGKDKLRTCHRCGGDTEDIPRRYVANVLTYSMRRCTVCKGYSRISIEPERMSIVRSV
jgi:hypothetical protein